MIVLALGGFVLAIDGAMHGDFRHTLFAMDLKPKAIVIALYFGNDLVDAATYAGLDHWRGLRAGGRAYDPPDLDRLIRVPTSANLAMALVDTAAEYSRVLSWAAYRVKSSLRATAWMASTYRKETAAPRCERGKIHTYFTPDYRTQAVDLNAPTVRDGLRITKVCLQRIVTTCKKHDVQPLLLFIHDKEHCYHGVLDRLADPAASSLAKVAGLEQRVTDELTTIANDLDLPVLDPTAQMRAALAADHPLWPAVSDDHLAAPGCELVAQLLQEKLAQFGVSGRAR